MTRSHVELQYYEKQEIIELKKANAKATLLDLKRMIKKKYGKDVGKSTISELLNKNVEKLVNAAATGNVKFRDRPAKYPKLEEVLYLWFLEMRHHKAIVNDSLLRRKALDFKEMLGIENFELSDGWMSKFKKRYRIAKKLLHGKADNIALEIVET